MTRSHDDLARHALWGAIKDFAVACGADPAAQPTPARMDAVAAIERTLDLIRKTDEAALIGRLEAGVRGAEGCWPGWIYEARQAIRSLNETLPWKRDLLEALGWESGTVYDALQCVYRLVAADKERESNNV